MILDKTYPVFRLEGPNVYQKFLMDQVYTFGELERPKTTIASCVVSFMLYVLRPFFNVFVFIFLQWRDFIFMHLDFVFAWILRCIIKRILRIFRLAT